MTVFRLSPELIFPPPELADPSGLLAVGGDLSTARLLLAYQEGIFPWYSAGEPILWWSPDPRMVLYPEDIHLSRSLRKEMNRSSYRVTLNTAFSEVIRACARVPRQGQDGTWITEEMERAYVRLHRAGHAHSVEVWQEENLIGGLYGVGMGRCFFGESMFHERPNTSKIALVYLLAHFSALGGELVDCQQNTPLLASLGAREIPRVDFLHQMREAVAGPSVLTGEPRVFTVGEPV